MVKTCLKYSIPSFFLIDLRGYVLGSVRPARVALFLMCAQRTFPVTVEQGIIRGRSLRARGRNVTKTNTVSKQKKKSKSIKKMVAGTMGPGPRPSPKAQFPGPALPPSNGRRDPGGLPKCPGPGLGSRRPLFEYFLSMSFGDLWDM